MQRGFGESGAKGVWDHKVNVVHFNHRASAFYLCELFPEIETHRKTVG